MTGTSTLRGQVEAQQRLIEEQRVESQRQRTEIELQFRRTAAMQVQLDRIQLTLQQAALNLRPAKQRSSNGNDRHAAPTSVSDQDVTRRSE